MGTEKMLRMYLLQICFNLSDPATEDAEKAHGPVLSRMAQSSRIGAVQAFVLMLTTIGTLLYILNKA